MTTTADYLAAIHHLAATGDANPILAAPWPPGILVAAAECARFDAKLRADVLHPRCAGKLPSLMMTAAQMSPRPVDDGPRQRQFVEGQRVRYTGHMLPHLAGHALHIVKAHFALDIDPGEDCCTVALWHGGEPIRVLTSNLEPA